MKKTTNTEHKPVLNDSSKSFIIATLVYGIIICILFFIRFWPPSDAELALLGGGGGGGGSLELNFGTTDFGSGDNKTSDALDVDDSKSESATTNSAVEDEIITEDDVAAPNDAVIKKVEKPKTPVKTPTKTIQPKDTKPKISKNTDDILSSIKGGKKNTGDGNSNSKGNQGSKNGNLNGKGYYGGDGDGEGGGKGKGKGGGDGDGEGDGKGKGKGGGTGSGVGYSLGNRKPLSKPNPEYNCGNEYGTVVVLIEVDKNGNVIKATPGYKGTKNPDSCLLAEAKKAALKTKWQPSPDGAERQQGTITYNFLIRD